jgi:hypothetical protein
VETAFYSILGKIDVGVEKKGIQRGRCKQLLDELKETRGHCNLKRKKYIAFYGKFALEEAMDLL